MQKAEYQQQEPRMTQGSYRGTLLPGNLRLIDSVFKIRIFP